MKKDLMPGLLEKVFGTSADVNGLKNLLKTNYYGLLTELQVYESIYGGNISEKLEDIYKKISRMIIDGISEQYFKMPIEVAIATKKQEEIERVFEGVAERLGFNDEMQLQILIDLEDIANSINKRFKFDQMALIHLIEASKLRNIQDDEGFRRSEGRNGSQILRQNENGEYEFVTSDDKRVHTNGKKINPNDASNIEILSYPGGKDLIGVYPTEEIMRRVMKNLFDNLELCLDTYKFYYTRNPGAPLEQSRAIENVVTRADDSQFRFYFKINNINLPHLLGIQRGKNISRETMRYFDNAINENSSAMDVLKVMLANKERIIRDGGLIQQNGKLYQLFPWEKIILKTTSFIRGDFFRTCFCLKELEHGLFSKDEKYAAISQTRYSENIVHDEYDPKRVLDELIKLDINSDDFVFRTFVETYRDASKILYRPDSMATGKGEDIVTINGVLVETLNKYRNIISPPDNGIRYKDNKGKNIVVNRDEKSIDGSSNNGSEDAQIVKSIENERVGKKIFTPEEQAMTHLSVVTNLGLNSKISEEAMKYEMHFKELIEKELNLDLEKLLKISYSNQFPRKIA